MINHKNNFFLFETGANPVFLFIKDYIEHSLYSMF